MCKLSSVSPPEMPLQICSKPKSMLLDTFLYMNPFSLSSFSRDDRLLLEIPRIESESRSNHCVYLEIFIVCLGMS